jgi:hypothetical protein
MVDQEEEHLAAIDLTPTYLDQALLGKGIMGGLQALLFLTLAVAVAGPGLPGAMLADIPAGMADLG